jgi:hypothetical protein
MPLSTQNKFDRIKNVTKIDPSSYDVAMIAGFKTKIVEFSYFFNKISPMLANKRTLLSNIMRNKQGCNQSYANLNKVLNDYEDLNLTNYLDYNTNGLIFNHADNT